MDGHQVTLVMVQSQTSHNTSVKKIRIFFGMEWEPSAKQFWKAEKSFFSDCFFFFFFYITCDLFECNCRISIKVNGKSKEEKKRKGCFYICALLA